MKKYLKPFVLLLALMMVISFSACTPDSEEPPADPVENGDNGDVEEPADLPSVALALPGPIADMGWNASAYAGLMLIEENYGAEVSYTESISQSDIEDVLRNYASAGFGVVFAHGSQFQDAVLNTAPEFPDTMFVILNGLTSQSPNVSSVQVADEEQGFLMGAFAALMTETGTVGVIGGAEIPPITNAVKGFEAGAAYADPSVNVLSAMTGSFEDVSAAKETALAQIDQGADYIAAIANQAGLGALEATAERGVYSIGANVDQFESSPTSVVTSVEKNVSLAYDFAYSSLLDGSLGADVYRIGAAQGLVYFSPYHDFEDFVPDSVRDRMDEIMEELVAGNIKILE